MKPTKPELRGSAELLRAVLEGIEEEAKALDATRIPRSRRASEVTKARAEKLGLRLIVNPDPEPSAEELADLELDIEVDHDL